MKGSFSSVVGPLPTWNFGCHMFRMVLGARRTICARSAANW